MNEYMKEAIKEAYDGIQAKDGGPFGTVIVRKGIIVGRGHNRVLAKKDPALWQRVCSMPNSKSEFLHEIETDLQYIISHGGASFKRHRSLCRY